MELDPIGSQFIEVVERDVAGPAWRASLTRSQAVGGGASRYSRSHRQSSTDGDRLRGLHGEPLA